ncbi:MAG: adenylate/guanylate cyclase domain-containing protein [Nannocystaceae bacterium]|nr:adenylate/guanylate cyclase domain-containing protein [Myxococcales bacterium]
MSGASKPADEDNSFEHVFRMELLASERARTRALTAIFLSYFVFLGGYWLLQLIGVQSAVRVPVRAATVIMITLALYEAVIARAIRKAIAERREIAWWLWYVNGVIEISVPTITMILLADYLTTAVYTLATPAFAIYFLFITLSTLRLNPRLCVFIGVVASLEYLCMAVVLVRGAEVPEGHELMFYSWPYHIQRGILLSVVGVTAAFVAREIHRRSVRVYEAQAERAQLLNLFGQHTSPAIVEQLLRHRAELKSRRQRVCIMFLDIRGFTRFSEERAPEAVVDYLNTLFAVGVAEVNRHDGIIHQLLGDGFMAIFGAPLASEGDCQNAVDAALAILTRVGEEVDAGRLPPTRIGVGLHAGVALTGLVGAEGHREYKVTGDVVNLAARIEQLNKQFESQCLVTQAVLDAATPKVTPRDLGEIEIRGRAGTVHVYQLA